MGRTTEAVKPVIGNEDRDRAELEYLISRIADIHAELRQNEAELGFAIDDAKASKIVAEVVSVLRSAGKAELALRYGMRLP
jgi:hypothetical protein